MSNFRSPSQPAISGFTIVEMLIIAPIVLLTIGAFITVIVNITGEVLASRNANVLAYNVQDTLNRIENDVKANGTSFVEANRITPLTSPQGYDDNIAGFSNVGASGTMLILNTPMTTGNPATLSSNVLYFNAPNSCASLNFNKNATMMMNIVYFVKTDAITNIGTLWRRTIVPSNYLTAGTCGTPWQQPSCLTGSGTLCTTQDIRLLDGIAVNDFVLQYFTLASDTVPNSIAGDIAQPAASRATALQSATTVGATLTASKTAAGRTVSQTGTMRVSRVTN